MNIALVEPFFSGSHQQWAEGYKKYSQHTITIFSLPGRYWKWRMHIGAPALAKQVNASNQTPDLFLVSDMLDVAVFRALLRPDLRKVPIALYFHENQITYPWSPNDADVQEKRDLHYGFINFTSALAANKVFFNSHYHQQSLLTALPAFLKKFPDEHQLDTVQQIADKSSVLHLGMDLSKMTEAHAETESTHKRAVILWNHRWEYDKRPEAFFEALFALEERGVDFRVIVLGEQFENSPAIFEQAKGKLNDKILHFGFAEDYETYVRLLAQSDIALVTSNQDFFGGSVVEAMYMNVKPLLPKRLAYPEHIPESLHQTFFYEDDKEIVNKLQRLVFNVGVIRKQEVRKFVERYDWKNTVSVYDAAMQQLV